MSLSKIFWSLPRAASASISNCFACVNTSFRQERGYNTSILCCLSRHLNSVKMLSQNAPKNGSSNTSKNPQKPITITIEGNIGSGKTTLLEYFSKQEDVSTIDEPVQKWQNVRGHNLFDLMYRDPCRWSFAFQSYVQLTMLENHRAQVTTPIKMMERSVHSARYCFVENMHLEKKMSDPEFVVLDELYQWVVSNHHLDVDRIIYLRATPEQCHKRILRRCRTEEEGGISLAYLKDLHQRYEDWLIDKKFPVPGSVMVLDATATLEQMLMMYETKLDSILCRGQ